MVQGTATDEAVMSGHGFYNRHSVLQANAVTSGLAALDRAAAAAPLDGAGATTLVDYGCSQGQNSMPPMGRAVSGLRGRGAGPIAVVHTDLPDNDFGSLFEVLGGASSYLAEHDDTFAFVVGRSFYEQLLPPATVSLGWSSITTHWLSEVPAPVPDHVDVQAGAPAEVRGEFAARAARDWQDFLDARARELRPDGRLVMVEPCARPDGSTGSEPMMQLLDEVMASMVADGLVEPDRAAAATLPIWLRTPGEYGSPIDEHPDLEACELTVLESVEDPLWAAFRRDGDAGAYATAAVDSIRAWSGAVLGADLGDGPVLDEFFHRCRVLGAADPERLHVHTFHLLLHVRRR